jgi:hypothetical protein
MKRFAIASLSILCLSLVATTSVKAGTRTGYLSMVETTSGNTKNTKIAPAFVTTSGQAGTRTGYLSMVSTTTIGNTESTGITPFELVSRAYQGAYKMQGVPGFGSFLTESSNHTITAKDIIKAAIELKQLAPETQADANYIIAVDVQLFSRQH